MFLRILKKDLKRKKAMNFILFVFVFICALFLSASVTNLMRSNNALQKFADMSKTADYYIWMGIDQPEFEKWIKNNERITDYEVISFIRIDAENIAFAGKKASVSVNSLPHLSTPSEKYNLVFDENDNRITSVKKGKIAIPRTIADKNNVKQGDTIDITIEGMHKKFTIAHILKDYVFGSDYMSISRCIVNQSDYDEFESLPRRIVTSVWSLKTDDINKLINDKNHQDFIIGYEFDAETVSMIYHLEKITSVVMLIISAMLIVIAMSLLRFTIRFSIEDDFREIGVMKAIGLKNDSVRWVYLIKYFAITLVGAAAGAVCMLPLANLLSADLSKQIVLREGNEIYAVCVCSAAGILGLVMLFSWLATGRIKKMTAIQAIREGSSGERFRGKGIMRLRGHKRVSVPLFMAVNDILSGLRNYIVIFLALVAGLQMILLPFNALTTLKDGDILRYFVMSPADIYSDIPAEATESLALDRDFEKIVSIANQMEREYADYGIDVNVNIGLQFSAQIYTTDQYDQIGIQAFKQTNGKIVDIDYMTGTVPILPNEIAMTNICMEKLGVSLGDSVHMVFGDDDKEYIITAGFESMSNGGESIVLSPDIYPNMLYCGGILPAQFIFNNREDIQGQTAALRTAKPELEYYTPDETVRQTLKSTVDGMEQMINTLTVIALGIIALVTFLICYTLLTRDKSSIALLKSIGFSKQSIRLWQIIRIVIVTLISDIAGVGLSFVLNPFVTQQTFGMMGAVSVPTKIDTVSVFGIYPALFLGVTTLVAIISAHSVNRVDMRNVGNLE